MKYGVDLNMDQNQIQNAVIQPLASAPNSGVAGQIYFNSTDKKLYQHDGTTWKQVGIASAISAGDISANSFPLTLTESDGATSTVTIVGAGGATLTKSGSTVTITTSDNDTTYETGTLEQLQEGGYIYELTEDTAIDPEKTYYTRSGSGTTRDPYIYTEVEEPDVADIGTYYELVEVITTPFVWNPVVLSTYVSGLNALAWEHADTALAAAQAAQADADDAAEAAASAQADATTASTAASNAVQSANSALSSAQTASTNAQTAMTNAAAAVQSAATAEQAAQSASTAASSATDSADTALENANSAIESAQTAWKYLSNVEDVVGTIEWIREHAVYEPTQDTEVDLTKWYYSVTGTEETNPTKYYLNHKRYYTLDNGVYLVSTESELDPQETYYTITAEVYPIDSWEDPSEYGLYEITSYDESVRDYIDNYLALDGNGLHLQNDTGGRIDISTTNGVELYNSSNKKVAVYGENTIIGDDRGYHIKIIPGDSSQGISPRLSFYAGDETTPGSEVAYMTDDKLWIPNVVVVKSMQAGNWMWDSGSDANHLTLRWIEGGE